MQEVTICVIHAFKGRVFCFPIHCRLQNMKHGNFSRAVPQRPGSHLSAHLHVVSTLLCKGFRHFDGSRAPKCSSHPCFGVIFASSYSAVAVIPCSPGRLLVECGLWYHCFGRKSANYSIDNLVPGQIRTKYFSASAASCSNNVSVSQQYRVLSSMP